ncbi:MAG: hypothetical protein CMH82_16525, partial [Nocardioides sp.]|nr:hypothetical protein [Nocardioides sp.]
MRAIVGNGPLGGRDRERIAAADHIIRFNLTPNRLQGERTDELFLSCSSKQIGEYLSNGIFRDDPAFRDATRLVMTYHPDIIRYYMPQPNLLSRLIGRRNDWSALCEKIAAERGKETETLPAELYRAACEILGIDIEREAFFPSSGFLAVLRELQDAPQTSRLEIFG